MMTTIANHWTDNDINNTEALRRNYLKHYDEVRSKVPKDRLLEFQAQDGWEPLCGFLGKPVPKDEPYPWVNEGNWLVKAHVFIYWYRLWGCVRMYFAGGVLAAAVGVGVWRMSG